MPTPNDDGREAPKKSSEKAAKRNGLIFYFVKPEDLKKFAKKYRTQIAASSASVVSTFVAFPLDFVKSRMQSYHTGFVHTVTDAYMAEGLRAFWRGVGPPMISVTVVRTISFSIYQKAKYTYDASIQKMTGKSPLEIANAPGSYPTLLTIACFGAGGATAGALITSVACPFELTKLSEQLAGKMYRAEEQRAAASGNLGSTGTRTGSWNTAMRLVRDRGFAGLYSGWRLHLLRDTLGTAIYFATYESVKQLMANARGKSPTNPHAVFIAGGLCGVVSWAVIYPVDVAKTVYQKALLSAGSGPAERPAIKFFAFGSYRGLGVSVVRSCIVNATFFSGFEMVKKKINALEA